MIRLLALWSSLAALALFSACSDDASTDAGTADTGTPDSGVSRDATSGDPDALPRDSGADPNACDPSIAPIPGGGAGGGQIRGALTVFAQAAESAEPIAGAKVIAQFGGNDFIGVTAENGCVAFHDARIGGAGRIHVFAENRVYLSLVGFNAAVTTVNLAVAGGGTPLQPATIAGEVSGFSVLTASTATIARVGYVEPIPTDVFVSQPDQTRRAENMNVGANVVVVGRNGALDFRDYLVHAEPYSTVGVAVRAGTITFPRFGSPVVELTHDGYAFGFDVAEGAAITGKDLRITHPLTETVTLTYGNTPALPSFAALTYVVLPQASGWFFHAQTTVAPLDNTAVFDGFPALDGVLSGATYGAVLQVSNDTAFSVIVEPGTASPRLDIGDLPEVPSNITAEGRAISANVGAPSTDLVLFTVDRESKGVWTVVFVNSSPEPAITLPAPPEGFEDPLAGRLDLSVLRARYEGVHFDDFSFDELRDAKLRSAAGDSVSVTF